MGHEETIGDMDMSTILNVLTVSQTYTYIQLIKSYILNIYVLVIPQEGSYKREKIWKH